MAISAMVARLHPVAGPYLIPRHAHSERASVARRVFRTPFAEPRFLGLGLSLSHPAAAVIIVLASYSSEHVEKPVVYGSEHASVWSSGLAVAICHEVGRPRASTRMDQALILASSPVDRGRTDSRSTYSTSSMSPEQVFLRHLNSSGRASFDLLSFSAYQAAMVNPRSAAKASGCSLVRSASCSVVLARR